MGEGYTFSTCSGGASGTAGAAADGESGFDGGAGGDPVCEGLFAVLDDAADGGK